MSTKKKRDNDSDDTESAGEMTATKTNPLFLKPEALGEISVKFDTGQVSEKRTDGRAPLLGSITIFKETGVFWARGTCLDLSESGAGGLVGKIAINKGDTVVVEFSSPSSVATFSAKCVVQRLRASDQSADQMRIGFKFVNLTSLTKKRIAEYIKEVRSKGFGDQNTF